MILDTMIGMVLLGAMLATLIAALAQHGRVSETLADQREGARMLEAIAIDLRSGKLDAANESFELEGLSSSIHIGDIDGFEVLVRRHEDSWLELFLEEGEGGPSLFVRLPAGVREGRP
ncbi:MAG: hypothetical protein AAGF84_05635 [Planctomycetota bacterium]